MQKKPFINRLVVFSMFRDGPLTGTEGFQYPK